MSLISDIEKFKEETFWFILFDLIFLIAPGILILFYFDRTLFLSLEAMKLILLSISSTVPFIFINVLCFWSLIEEPDTKMKKDDVFIFFTLGIFLSNIIFSIVLLISYLLNLSFRTAMCSMVGFEIFLIILIFYKETKK